MTLTIATELQQTNTQTNKRTNQPRQLKSVEAKITTMSHESTQLALEVCNTREREATSPVRGARAAVRTGGHRTQPGDRHAGPSGQPRAARRYLQVGISWNLTNICAVTFSS